VAREITKAKLPYNVNVVTLEAAAVALRHRSLVDERVQRLIEQRERLTARLRSQRGLTVFPSAANFLLVRFERHPARTVFQRLLDEHGILVRDVSGGAELSQCLRISIGTAEDMDAVADALSAILAS